MEQREKRKLRFYNILYEKTGNKKVIRIATEDIIAVGCVIVAILISIGILFRVIEVKSGAYIIIVLLGGGGIAKIIKARRQQRKKQKA